MDVQQNVLIVLDEALSLNGRARRFERGTYLLGAIPELDSMAIVAVITGLEDRFGVEIGDDDLDGQVFTTVGSLVDFVQARVAA